jgi:beta-aspartyl-peptidase (threonine type)
MVEAIVVVHGGAGTCATELHDAAVAGTRAAAAVGLACLSELDPGAEESGAPAKGQVDPELPDACVEASIAAVRMLEDDPTFNAGRGSCMTQAGELEVDAGIMRSRDLKAGAVAAVRDLANACELARAVMERCKHILLVGEGARRFGLEHGIGRFSRELVWTPKAQQRFELARVGTMPADNRSDTVGAVVRDRRGQFCALGSTGGVLLKLPGRVGDTPIIGAGFYAHPELGAAVATGVGEAIMRRVGCYELLRRVAAGQPIQDAAAQLCAEIHEADKAAVGFIAIGPQGEVAVAHASEHMSWAIARDGAELQAGLFKRA